MDWMALACAIVAGGVSSVVTVTALRVDVRWLKEQVKALWAEFDIIAPRRVKLRDR